MGGLSRDRDRARLEQEIETEEYQELLVSVQRREPFLQRFRTWREALDFMRCGSSRDPRKDRILRPILEVHAEDGDPRCLSILLAIFWPGLESIQARRRRWDRNAEERWQNIALAFLGVVSRVDVRTRPERLVQKIFNDTVHRVYGAYQRIWSRTEREILMDPAAFDEFVDLQGSIDVAAIGERKAQEREVEKLRDHLDAGRISDADFALVVGTCIYRQSVADYARAAGLDYEVAKKRRQRALAAIRRFASGSLSPSEDLSPL